MDLERTLRREAGERGLDALEQRVLRVLARLEREEHGSRAEDQPAEAGEHRDQGDLRPSDVHEVCSLPGRFGARSLASGTECALSAEAVGFFSACER